MKILLTNDDGIYAPGLAALYQELSIWGKWRWWPRIASRAPWDTPSP